MLLKALLFAVLIYFVLRTVTRLIHAMKTEEPRPPLNRESASRWEKSSPQRSYEEEDVEDAKFVDV